MQPLKNLVLPGEAVLAFVGAGGKTSLIYSLARQLSGWGARVVVTTTTRMLRPSRNFLLLDAPRVPPYRHLTVGRDVEPETGKVVGVDPGEIPEIRKRFGADYVLVEADGAAGRSVKAPAPHEPVIPGCADAVFGVMGLDCLELPAGPDIVFRLERFLAVTGLSSGDPITPEALRALENHPEGLFKGAPGGARRVAFHNKADTFPKTGTVYGSALRGWFVSLE